MHTEISILFEKVNQSLLGCDNAFYIFETNSMYSVFFLGGGQLWIWDKDGGGNFVFDQYADLILILDDFNGYPAILFRYFQFCFYGIVNEIGQGDHKLQILVVLI